MKHAKNYPVIIISKEDFEKFKKQYMLDVIRDPTYRYGQAFMNYFKITTFGSMPKEDTESALWYTSSKEKAEYLLN